MQYACCWGKLSDICIEVYEEAQLKEHHAPNMSKKQITKMWISKSLEDKDRGQNNIAWQEIWGSL